MPKSTEATPISEEAKHLVDELNELVNGFLFRSSYDEVRENVYRFAQDALDKAYEKGKQDGKVN